MPPKISKAKKSKKPKRVPAGFTENGAISFTSTGSARLDLFFKACRDIPELALHTMLTNSWKEDALDTVRIVFQARDCRGGKGEKLLFRQALVWLANNHLDVLLLNLKHVPFFGTWKDPLCLVGSPAETQALSLLAEQLKADMEKLQSNPKAELTLAAKWAPTERHADDKGTKAAKKLAKLVFPNSEQPLRDFRKQCLVPLRTQLRVVEQKMCSGEWNRINYQAVPSRCMNKTRKAFEKHDKERFAKYLEDVASGKKTIKASQVFPHELVNTYMAQAGAVDQVVELQWAELVKQVKASNSLSDALVISDVSGSMSGVPMQVSIALGLLISEVIPEPFHHLVITFSERPEFHRVKGTTLKDRVQNLQHANWGSTTNFQAVFDMILQKAIAAKLPAYAMPSKLIVISDMQFNVAGSGNFYTNHQVLKQKYKAAGYEMPTIVYWNVRATTVDFPVDAHEAKVAMVSGFSQSLLKLLCETGEISPASILRKAIDDKRYAVLELPK